MLQNIFFFCSKMVISKTSVAGININKKTKKKKKYDLAAD